MVKTMQSLRRDIKPYVQISLYRLERLKTGTGYTTVVVTQLDSKFRVISCLGDFNLHF